MMDYDCAPYIGSVHLCVQLGHNMFLKLLLSLLLKVFIHFFI